MIETLTRMGEGLYYFWADETLGASVLLLMILTSAPAAYYGTVAAWSYVLDFTNWVKRARKNR